jgi:hypothetical protein
MAEELGTVVLSTNSQPGSPDSTSALKNVRLEEPDAALFRPPDGYRVVDETTQFTITVDAPAKPSEKPQPPMPVTALTGLPYSAERVLEMLETLPDGTHLSRAIPAVSLHRDLMGRTRTENFAANAWAAKIEIVDVVAGYRYGLDPDNHIAVRTPVRVTEAKLATEASIPSHSVPRPGREWLGTQTIDGMLTYGERVSPTLAAGSSVDERWFSPQLGVAMLIKTRDPIVHELVTTLKNLKFGEPEASLFRVPEGYQIVDDPRIAAR